MDLELAHVFLKLQLFLDLKTIFLKVTLEVLMCRSEKLARNYPVYILDVPVL